MRRRRTSSSRLIVRAIAPGPWSPGVALRALRAAPLVVFLSLGLAFCAGCSQGLGDRCEQDSDCEDGLICTGTKTASAEGGTCQPFGITGGVDAATIDSGQDLGADLAPAVDASGDRGSDAQSLPADAAVDTPPPDAPGVE
jgi:hypothetical protein